MINRNNALWDFMAKTLKNNDYIQDSYNNILLLTRKKKYLEEISHRASLSIFDYEHLAAELPFCPLERIADSNFYGHALSLKEYANVEKQNFYIEHGLYFDQYISAHTYWKAIKGVITINAERELLLKEKVGKPAYAIGPYIYYAEPLLNMKEMNEIKCKYGKILLFFPSHSCVELASSYDVYGLVDRIKQFSEKNGFDTVFCNLFYHDILHNNYKNVYEKAGFKIVTSGHRFDYNFIRRLKSLILISDYTIGNSVGTHIGYSILLDRPHYIILDDQYTSTNSLQYKRIAEPFLEAHDEITKKQKDITSYYWGFDCIKSRDELRHILETKI